MCVCVYEGDDHKRTGDVCTCCVCLLCRADVSADHSPVSVTAKEVSGRHCVAADVQVHRGH